MFAFCIWDRVNQRAFLARDRIGIKPLYYSVSDQYLTFASELKALIQDPSFPRTVDTAAVDAYVSFGYIPAPRSIFEHARKLLPAHYLIWDHGNVTINRYWSYDPAVEEPDPGLDTWLNRLRDTLQVSVPAQMVSDVPVGALLSGGIDSSLVVRMMASSSAAVTTSSMGFGVDSFDELPYARMVAEQFGTDHSEHRISPDLMGILPKLAWHLDEPFGDSSIVPTYYVCKAIRESVKVALSGDGGDELFAGYTRYQGEQFSKLFTGLPLFLKNLIGATSRRIPPDWSAGLRRMKRVLSATELGFLDRYLAKGSICDTATKQRLLGGLSDHSDDSRGALEGIVASNDDFVQNLIRLDLEFYLPNDMLMKVDKMSMASSLEVRVPLLDESVVALAAQMPTRHKLRGFQTKYILRKLSEESLPPQITRRKKQGFGMPVQDWFRGDLREMARDLLSTSSHFEQNTVETVLDEHHRQVEDHGHLIFALLMFELWHKAFSE
jgi:asparagine synthase (glutamine-hydrolysing)